MNDAAIRTIHHQADLCVVGGGLAGLCAAVAAARGGSRVVLMQERPMVGGNASSEVRMWVGGAHGSNNRETGILEEICLENLYRNGTKNYYIWDGILYETVRREPNIELLLNCSCCSAKTEGNRIVSVTGWQMTTQQWHTVEAAYFSDCSGDSVLAPLTGAEYRLGREDPAEFGEICTYTKGDRQTMGMSCLLQGRLLDHPVRFTAPEWATKLTPEIAENRPIHMMRDSENFWYLELGGNLDSIADTERVRDELVALAYGVWDHVKNSGTVENADYWDLEFLGILPGKRESRRMVGPYIMTQGDILAGGHFDDVVAYGGWPLDDHDPDGYFHYGAPNICVTTPAPYGIPYRCLYSANIENLFFAGRNISMTHAAMSSSRVMATCAILGQAVGTAADIAREYHLTPEGVRVEKLSLLQNRLMEAGCFLPGMKREIADVCRKATLTCRGALQNPEALRNGADRNNRTYPDAENGAIIPLGTPVTYRLEKACQPELIHVAFDSDLDRVTLPGSPCEREHAMRCNILPDSPVMHLPKTLPKRVTVKVCCADHTERILFQSENNRLPVLNLTVEQPVTEISLLIEELWHSDVAEAHVFSFDFR